MERIRYLQTNYSYNASGHLTFIDHYGVREDARDDRYIERFYEDTTNPDLVTTERVRDTTGRVVAKTTYRYVLGKRLIAAEGHWLLQEGRPLTTTWTYDARGLRVAETNPLNQTTRYGYDAVGNQTVITDTLGFVTRRVYDRQWACDEPYLRSTQAATKHHRRTLQDAPDALYRARRIGTQHRCTWT